MFFKAVLGLLIFSVPVVWGDSLDVEQDALPESLVGMGRESLIEFVEFTNENEDRIDEILPLYEELAKIYKLYNELHDQSNAQTMNPENSYVSGQTKAIKTQIVIAIGLRYCEVEQLKQLFTPLFETSRDKYKGIHFSKTIRQRPIPGGYESWPVEPWNSMHILFYVSVNTLGEFARTNPDLEKEMTELAFYGGLNFDDQQTVAQAMYWSDKETMRIITQYQGRYDPSEQAAVGRLVLRELRGEPVASNSVKGPRLRLFKRIKNQRARNR